MKIWTVGEGHWQSRFQSEEKNIDHANHGMEKIETTFLYNHLIPVCTGCFFLKGPP